MMMLKQIFAVSPCPYYPPAAASIYSAEQQRFYVSYSLIEGCMVTTTSLSSNQVKYIVNHHVMVILTVNNICRDRANSSVLLVVVDGLCIVQSRQSIATAAEATDNIAITLRNYLIFNITFVEVEVETEVKKISRSENAK